MVAPLEKILFIPDSHIPYEDKGAFGLMLKAMRSWRPHRIVILGDFADCYSVSRHDKDPNRARDFQYEVDAVNAALDKVDALGAKKKHYVAGNHEEFLSRHLASNSAPLFNVVKVERLFRLKERGWTYTPYKKYTRVGKMFITHDTGSSGATAHTQSQARFGSNVIIGHTHRASITYKRTISGDQRVAAMAGWLGDYAMAEYLHEAATVDWVHSFAIGRMEKNGTVHIGICPLVRGKVVVEGKVYCD